LHANAPIRFHQVTLSRGSTNVYRDLSLELAESRIGLIGDNGAGKSSLFRLICGLDAPSRGEVSVCGHPATDLPPGTVGMMFQNPDEQILFPTVEEELAFSLSASGTPRREARTRARDFLADRGLSDWTDRAIGSLSQGQRQHVCWLAMVIASPRILLLDEPFASLDLPSQALLQRSIDCAVQQVIVSTHQLGHVRDFGRVIWIDQGRVRADGPGHEVCAAYEADVHRRLAGSTQSLRA
jgi:biotin transport system ATP-binding protein